MSRQEFLSECAIHDQLRLAAQGLNIVMVETILRVKVGGIVRVERHVESLTRNSYNKMSDFPFGFILDSTYADGSLGMKDTGAIVREGADDPPLGCARTDVETGEPFGPLPMGYFSNTGDYTSGIVAGRSAKSESIDDYKLDTLIVHGTGGNQMEYAAATVTKGYNGGIDYYWSRWSRILTNNSSALITVEEVGAVFRHNTRALYKFLMIRDLTGGIAVTVGQTLEIQYETRVNLVG